MAEASGKIQMILAGFRSRWTMPMPWTFWTFCSSCSMTVATTEASATERAPLARARVQNCLAEAAKLGHAALEQDLAQRLKAVKSEQRYKSWRREKARKGKSERLQAQARAQKAREAAAEQEAEQKRASARKYKEWLRQKHREGRSTKKAKALEEERTRLDERLRDQQLRALNDLEFDRCLAEKQAGEQDLGRRRQAEEQEYRRQRRTAEEKRLVDLYRHHHAELSWQVPPTPRGRRW